MPKQIPIINNQDGYILRKNLNCYSAARFLDWIAGKPFRPRSHCANATQQNRMVLGVNGEWEATR